MTFRGNPSFFVFLVYSIYCSAILTRGDYPFRNVSLPWDARVDNLVSLLTIDEIQEQMARGGHGPHVSPAPAIPRLGVGPYSWNTECLDGDVDAGPATSFPQALGLAATFSPDLVERVARATGLEVRAKYNNYTQHGLYGDHRGLSCFSPVINIMRDPRWGRNQETYGEDPILSGILATSFVHGLQGNDTRYVLANAGCKHFDAHGGPENIPYVYDHHIIKTPCLGVSRINGVPSCANKKLLTDILRTEWGFKGYVVSDEMALEWIITGHHYANDNVTAAAAAVNAGVSLEISPDIIDNVFAHIVAAVKAGKISEDTVRSRVKPLFYTRMRLGEFDPPDMNPYTQVNVSLIQSPAHRDLALEAAVKSLVLLKNQNGFLPLKQRFNQIAVVGPMSNSPAVLYGDYSPTINETLTVTPLNSLGQLSDVVYSADGCSNPRCTTYDSDSVFAAVSKAEVTFVCLGTSNVIESEGNDRADLELPGKQLQMLKDVVSAAGGKPVVLLLFNAGPLNITWAVNNSAVVAILECFFPAQTAGTAIYRALTNYNGVSSPAGRLPATWPLLASQIPDMVNYSMAGRTYRYFEGQTLYPFGYGLSYTTFNYSDLKTPATLNPGQDLVVQVTVANTGQVTADEVTQVYVQWLNSSVPTPRLQLVAFNRTTLYPSQPQTLTFTVKASYLEVYTDNGWEFEPGPLRIYVGGQQPGQEPPVGSNVLSAIIVMTSL
ncbi:hypothetical protein C0Q70_10558 [Pomacea canaliculata]|uniref:Fibronectin type III-like domain-containing protein n=1 Tax=Pomacea canaliculata TaxID=400727 RepID=A0A2T7P3H8_POMCA|nr:hypothetical protein C0Q70_10558 [Pomacea canaliculata]